MLHPDDPALDEMPPEPPYGLALLAFMVFLLGVMSITYMISSS